MMPSTVWRTALQTKSFEYTLVRGGARGSGRAVADVSRSAASREGNGEGEGEGEDEAGESVFLESLAFDGAETWLSHAMRPL